MVIGMVLEEEILNSEWIAVKEWNVVAVLVQQVQVFQTTKSVL